MVTMSRKFSQVASYLGKSSRPASASWKAKGVLFSVVLLYAPMTGCGELEPLVEQESVDLQLTVDTLRTQVRDAQRTAMELRTEIEARRQELADAQVARAEMEGRLREAERRLVEARQVVELQREELVTARAERERVYRSRAPLKSGAKPRQKALAQPGNTAESAQDVASPVTGAMMRQQQNAQTVPSITGVSSGVIPSTRAMVTPATLQSESPVVDQASGYTTPIRHISVKPGDTLWSLARKHGISLTQLRSLNHLTGNLIIVGQALRIPGNSAPPGSAGARDEGNQ